ncbi:MULTISPECIES: hypothetical protein [Cyanophyceae]|jgi:hypothetical protein|nr:hypothetical protein [Trichocoleus sp. FACHB-69]MBD1932516.1 hypothetical protein [Trichocoleus sp. FACHB-69]
MNKKILSLVLVLGLAATLGACDQTGGGGEGASPSPTVSPTASPTTSP